MGESSRGVDVVARFGPMLARMTLGVTLVAAGGWFAGCSDASGPCPSCPPPPNALIISKPVPVTGRAPGSRNAAAAPLVDSNLVYVSLIPGTAPSGARAHVGRVGDVTSLTTAVIDGGFDPFSVTAEAGDSIVVTVSDSSGTTVFESGALVRPLKPPVVVRTDPPPRKRDVPLNARIVIVFSEPVDASTLTSSSVRLLRGTTAVAGSVSLLPGTATSAVFTPAALLDANTDYQLTVTRAVRDLTGDALAADETLQFTTGTSLTGPAATIQLSPDSVGMSGATYQLSVTVRDSAGNQLVGQQITWSVTDASGRPATGLSVSPTGLLTAVAEGGYAVTAEVNGVGASAGVIVRFGSLQASLSIAPSPATVSVGDTVILTPQVRDASGRLLDRAVTWVSSVPAIATVASYLSGSSNLAVVTGVSQGTVSVTATSGAASAQVSVTVAPPPPVASVVVSPESLQVIAQGTGRLSVTLRDSSGRLIVGRAIAWVSADPTIAIVADSGVVTGIGPGTVAIYATSDGISDTAWTTVTTLQFRSIATAGVYIVTNLGFSAGGRTCGVVTTGAVFCWGPWGPAPVNASGGLLFRSVTVGLSHSCGLTPDGRAYCWGGNSSGELGNGSIVSSSDPVLVSGILSFSSLSAGYQYTCGLTTSGAAYCWGSNTAGQLGDGSTAPSSIPVAVTGGLTFSALSAGTTHTCGIATGGVAYCWGANANGQLGNGSNSASHVPMAVSGGQTFSSVSAALYHTCGILTNGDAYCWGLNSVGQLGSGTTTSSTIPVAVVGGLKFSELASGNGFFNRPVGPGHSCGLTSAGVAYCWGANSFGQLGDGNTSSSSVPVGVVSGLTFTSISVSNVHTCGVTTSGVAYCWGSNAQGQLGDGTTTSSSTPVKVLGQP